MSLTDHIENSTTDNHVEANDGAASIDHAPDAGNLERHDDTVKHSSDENKQETDSKFEKENEWYWDEDHKGSSEKPEWLNTKYKTVAEQAKAYNEVQKKLGAFKGAPTEYDLQHEDIKDLKLSADDPFLKDFLEDSKKQNVSQEYLNNILVTYKNILNATKPDVKAELEKLGPTAAQDIKSLGNWADNNFTKDEAQLIKNMMTSADSVRLLEKLRGVQNKADTAPQATNSSRETLADVRSMIHDPRYDSDENFRAMVREKLKQFG